MNARTKGVCPVCGESIKVGDRIRQLTYNGAWQRVHYYCLPPAPPQGTYRPRKDLDYDAG